MFKNRSKVLFIGSLLSTIYVVYLIIYFSSSQSTDPTVALAEAFAASLVAPHLVVMGLGAIFSWIGFGLRKAGFALVGAILYSVAAIIFLVYAPLCIPMIVLGFVGYTKQLKISKNINY